MHIPTAREFLSLLLFALSLVSWTAAARRLGRLSTALALPVGLALVVCWDALALNLLSPFRAVQASTLALASLAGNVIAFKVGRPWRIEWAADRLEFATALRLVGRALRPKRHGWALVPLLVMLAGVAYLYPSTNWDSMTYHMARVAHWMQHGSIGYYVTPNDRQNLLGPGAEYLILFLQSIAGTDRWANGLQLLSYVLTIVATAPLCRLAGVPSRLCPFAQFFVASLPMAVLEATTTQNDLVAAAMTVAIAACSLRFWGRPRRWAPGQVAVLSAAIAAAFLVKPTAILAAAPFFVVGLVFVAGQLLRKRLTVPQVLRSGALAVLILLAVIGPDAARKYRETGSPLGSGDVLFGKTATLAARAFNSVSTYCQNAVGPEGAESDIRAASRAVLGKEVPLFCRAVFSFNEDRTGNPLHASVALLSLLAGAVAVAAWKSQRRRWLFFLAPVAGWFAFHWFVKNQEFITRLQLPIFVLIPVGWGAWGRPRWLGNAAKIAATACLAYAFVVACRNDFRPIGTIPQILKLEGDRDKNYYMVQVWTTGGHNDAIQAAERDNCRRLGLYIGWDSYDYPLTWRAMRQGIEVRHLVGPSDWPCVVFSDQGAPPGQWIGISPGVYHSRKP